MLFSLLGCSCCLDGEEEDEGGDTGGSSFLAGDSSCDFGFGSEEVDC